MTGAFFSIFGCAVKKSSHSEGRSGAVSRSGSECDETQENGAQETVNYKSLIEKYVGKAGRNDFAAEYLKIYMAESFPEYYEGMEEEKLGEQGKRFYSDGGYGYRQIYRGE